MVGLSTARLLQLRSWDVTLYARDLPPRTTSNVAGGQWTPTSVFDRDAATPAFVEQFALASRIAYRYYQDFVGAAYGVRWIDNYYLSDEPPGESWLYALLPDVFASATNLEPHEHPFAASSVQRVRTMLIEPAVYLNALLRNVHVAGGRVVVGELRDRQEVAGLPERVVVNCTGLGAAALFGDEQLMPVKGQLTCCSRSRRSTTSRFSAGSTCSRVRTAFFSAARSGAATPASRSTMRRNAGSSRDTVACSRACGWGSVSVGRNGRGSTTGCQGPQP